MKFTYLRSLPEVQNHIRCLSKIGKPVVLDIETTGLDRFKDDLISIQLCIAGSDEAVYFDALHVQVLNLLTTPVVAQHFKFDLLFLEHKFGIVLKYNGIRDTSILHHLLDENLDHDLDTMVKERWGDSYKEEFWSKYTNFFDAPEKDRLSYACKDVIYTGKLYLEFLEALKKDGISDWLIDHAHRLALALYETELKGVKIDLEYLSKIGTELKDKIAGYKYKMREAAPEVELVELSTWQKEIDKRKTPAGKARVKRDEFNWDSSNQLKELVYGELGLPPVMEKSKSTGKMSPTLKDSALEELLGQHPIIEIIRDYRGDQKVYGSFIEGTLERHVGGRIYPSFNINGTVTGRISASNPNLQQLPREGGVRGIYVPDSGCKLISSDYGQLEVVIAAHYSQDPNLLKIINEGVSKHDITAAALGIPRQLAKTVNFASQYQCSHFKLAKILKCSDKEGMNAYIKYWETYKEEKKVIDACKKLVDEGRPIVTLFGRHRRFHLEKNSPKFMVEAAYRQAYSSLIQGTGADITHISYYNIANKMKELGLGRALFEVHDEIVVEALDSKTEEATKLVEDIMIQSGIDAGLSVPLTVDSSEPLTRWSK